MKTNGTSAAPAADLKAIAHAAGVSMATASRALNGIYVKLGGRQATADNIRRIARELGFRPHAHATALAHRRTRFDNIGVLVTGMGRMMAHPVLGACYHELNQAGKIMSLASMPGLGSKPQSLRMLKTTCLDGLVVAYAPPAWLLAELQSLRRPMVFVNAFDDLPANSFHYDDGLGARLAVEHLVALGHRRIQYMNASNLAAHYSVRRRLAGYCQALRDAGMSVPAGAGQLMTSRRDMSRWLDGHLAGPRAATAVVCYSTGLARTVLLWAYRARRRVPEELSIVDLGGHGEGAAAIPPLTGVELPVAQLVRAAVRHLLAMAAGRAGDLPPRSFAPRLVVRGTTARCAG